MPRYLEKFSYECVEKISRCKTRPSPLHCTRPFRRNCPYDLLLVINYFVRKNWFKYGYLNYHLQRLKLSGDPTGDNVPIIDGKNKKISGTATEIRKLLLIFPIAVAYSIKDSDDEVWQMVLSLRKMSSFACAPGPKVINRTNCVTKNEH